MSQQIFDRIEQGLKTKGADIVSQIQGTYCFNIGGDSWVVDLKNGNGSVSKGAGNAECTLTVDPDTFAKMVTGELNGQAAFMQGKLKLQGNMGLAIKLSTLFNSLPQEDVAPGKLDIDTIFSELQKHIDADKDVINRVGAIFKFVINTSTGARTFTVDLKNDGVISETDGNADTTLTLAEEDFIDLMTGNLNGQQAFMAGKLRLQGNMANAMKLSELTAGSKL
eukprot:TRINITY_DN2691_c0_g1_i1.p1 TRINITY_DN2691_c0_g1~~TRINITY_DN2691_c0_g1_i1.p1  ORF type:complete len:223 (-),score=61.22 TRINITY_DN2691_c0_g1_i1:54-722(-)